MNGNGHGGRREGAGRRTADQQLYRDRLIDLRSLTQQADADLRRAVLSVRMVDACAESILRDPTERHSWRQEKTAGLDKRPAA